MTRLDGEAVAQALRDAYEPAMRAQLADSTVPFLRQLAAERRAWEAAHPWRTRWLRRVVWPAGRLRKRLDESWAVLLHGLPDR